MMFAYNWEYKQHKKIKQHEKNMPMCISSVRTNTL